MQNKLVFINGEFSAKDSQLTDGVQVHKTHIVIEKNTRAHLLETFNTTNDINLTTALHLEDSALVVHEKIQDIDLDSQYESVLNVYQKANSQYKSVCITTGSKKASEKVFISFKGEGASCDINVLCKAKSSQHLSTMVSVDHIASNCYSMQNFRGVVSDKATADMDSKAFVRQGAAKSEAHQFIRNLLLDSSATVNANPQLEIYNDDVNCTHGATVGQLDDDALFYLQTRGISHADATLMLMDAFTNEITDKLMYMKVEL